MTPAPTMQTRSTLPREYLSAVTCQSTPSLQTGREPPEVRIAHEPTLPRACTLHGLEKCRVGVLGHVQAELGNLDPDRVETALLAEHDSPLGADELRRVRLGRGRVVELGGAGARLPREEVVSGHRLPGRERCPRELLHEAAQRTRLRQIEAGRDAVQRLERECHLDEVGVAGPLAYPVH